MKELTETSVVKMGQGNTIAWPNDKATRRYFRGGGPLHVTRSPMDKNITFKEEMKTSNRRNSPDSHSVNQLIRTADWVRARGQIHPVSEDPVLEEQIGILFNVLRRRKNMTLERLANQTGYRIEELIAFEAGLLKRLRMCEMLPVLAEIVGVKQEEWPHKIRSAKTKLNAR